MIWALINEQDNSWASGPLTEEPTAAEGQRVIFVPVNFPDECLWSPSLNGFVDIPKEKSVLSKLEFQRRFTQTERIAVRTSTNDIICDFHEMAKLAESIDLHDQDVINGVRYLESIGLLSEGRADQILG